METESSLPHSQVSWLLLFVRRSYRSPIPHL